MEVRLSQIVAPKFLTLWGKIKRHEYTHYWLKGGRSSTKSSFTSIATVLLVMMFPGRNAICFRKVGDTLRTSVYEQINWAIDKLGCMGFFKKTVSPMEIEYIPNGNRILFRGIDDAKKTKSIKLSKGYFSTIWFEELDEFAGMKEVRTALQSVMRGGKDFTVFYSYNPPILTSNWVNMEADNERPDKYLSHSTYLDVPKEWLGEVAILEAEHLKQSNPRAYEHEYLGKAIGTGGTIFPNVKHIKLSDEDIARFDNIRNGIDWGYVSDQFAFVKLHYDKTRRSVYVFDEIYQLNMLNPQTIPLVKAKVGRERVTADSSEPKSIDDFRHGGINCLGAKKGKGSVEYGIKWLQSLENIFIDSRRAPKTYSEFVTYELEKDKTGEFKHEVPDKNNHTIDALRYALEDDMAMRSSPFAMSYDN